MTKKKSDTDITVEHSIVGGDVIAGDKIVNVHPPHQAASESSTVPPPIWLDRSGVDESETAECQCELRLWTPDRLHELDGGEVAGELQALMRKESGHFVLKGLLSQASSHSVDGFRWAFKERPYGNVVNKWELAVGSGGSVSFRWATFTNGNIRFLETAPLVDAVVTTISAYQLAHKNLQKKYGLGEVQQLYMRIAAHGSGPLTLYDNLQVTELTLWSAISPSDWNVQFVANWRLPVEPIAIRLLNRALARFSVSQQGPLFSTSAGPSFARLDEEVFKTLFKRRFAREYADGLDAFGRDDH